MAQNPRTERRRCSRYPGPGAHTSRRAEISQVLSTCDAALNEVAQSALKTLNAAGVAIAIEVESKGASVCRARAGDAAPEVGTPVQPDHGITGECITSASVMRVDDTAQDTRVNEAACAQMGVRSILLAPLLYHGRAVGVVEAFFATPKAFDDTAVQYLVELAERIVRQVYRAEPMPVKPPEPPQPSDAPLPTAASETPIAVSEAVTREPVAEKMSQSRQPARDPFREALGPFDYTLDTPKAASLPRTLLIVIVLVVVLIVAGVLFARYRSTSAASQAMADASVRLERAAESGDPSAQYQLAQAYRTGTGVNVDPELANAWLLRAAESGNADAQMEWARAMEQKQENRAAYAWSLIARESGKTESEEAIRRLKPSLSAQDIAQVRYNVAERYGSGRGLPRDLVAAHMWYALSEWGGNKNARAPMRDLESHLTRAQLREARLRASTWIRSHSTPAAQKQNPQTATR
jgi:hypothetical protein